MRQICQVLSVFVVAGLLLVAVGGCQNKDDSSGHITAEDIRKNPSPEYYTTLRSYEQRQNLDAITNNLDGRQLIDDWIRLWQVRPSRLTPYPNLY